LFTLYFNIFCHNIQGGIISITYWGQGGAITPLIIPRKAILNYKISILSFVKIFVNPLAKYAHILNLYIVDVYENFAGFQNVFSF